MSDYIQKIKTWYADKKTGEISYERKGIKPLRDWEVILSLASVILLGLALFAVYFYMQINEGKFFVTIKNETGNAVKINNELLRKTIDDINSRAITLSKIREEKTVKPDPSL